MQHHYGSWPQAPGHSRPVQLPLTPEYASFVHSQSLQVVAYTFCSAFIVSIGGRVGLLEAYSATQEWDFRTCLKSLFYSASPKQNLKLNVEKVITYILLICYLQQ